jgi:hypothetical protein
MPPKKIRKLVQKTPVEKPTQDLEVPPGVIGEEELEDYEE